MAVIVLCSASGSPGVTTTAVALALNWPRPVLLVEADPTGGSGVLAGFLRGTQEYDAGLIEVALSPLGHGEALREVVRPLAPDVSFVAGVRAHTQAAALRDLWAPLALALTELDAHGQDVIVDAGRLGLAGSPQALLDEADLTLLLTRATLPGLAAARSWVEQARNPTMGWRRPGILLIGDGQPYGATEVTRVLGLPVLAALPDDADAAAVFYRGAAPPKRFATGPFARALGAAAGAIQAQVVGGRLALVQDPTP